MEAISTEVAVKNGTDQQPQRLLKEELSWINKVRKMLVWQRYFLQFKVPRVY